MLKTAFVILGVRFSSAVLGVLLACTFSASAQQIKVLQWNIHGNLGTATAQASAGAAAIARILNYLQPDVVLLNEVADGTVQTNTTSLTQWVSANLPYMASGSFYVAVSTEPFSVQRNAAISRYPILDPFTYDDVSTSLRGMFSFQLQLSGTNQLHVFHVHLKCCGDAPSCQAKQDEAQLFSDDIVQFAATNSSPYIFAGDLNEDEASPECTITASYHPITTLMVNGGLAEYKPTTLSGEYRTWSTSPSTPSIRFDYILGETNRLSPIAGFVFSTMDWAAHGLYTTASPQNLSSDTRTASDHYSVLATYSFPTNGSPAGQLSVGPAGGFTSTGPAGGSFIPGNQTYWLTNTGTGNLNWTVENNSNWVSLSATNGTLAPGLSSSVTVSISANANNLPPGFYSDTVSFTNTDGGAGSTTRSVSLVVNSPGGNLTATPASGFSPAGPPGGPFTPVNQIYTLSNSGNATLSWLATNGSNWVSITPDNGTLSPGSTALLTVSLNSNANTFAAGGYSDVVSVTNASNGGGFITRSVVLNVSAFGFFDDFGTFVAGDLIGQSNWTQLGATSTIPLQVTGGQVVIPFAQSADNQDAYKNFPLTSGTVFFGMLLTISNAPGGTPSYFAALWTGNNASGFANYRLTAKDNGGGTFVFGARITGQSTDPYTYGTTAFNYGTSHRVFLEADSGGTILKVYVDPTSPDLASQAIYLINNIGSATPSPSVGSLNISQFASGTAPNAGLSIAKVVVADNFASAYNALSPALTPFQTWQLQYFNSTSSPDAAPTADPDGDGMNNYAEFLAGTNPTNSASVFRIASIVPEGNDLRVTWSMGSGRTNILQRATALSDNFTDVLTIVTTGSVTNYLDPGAASGATPLYYRIRLGP